MKFESRLDVGLAVRALCTLLIAFAVHGCDLSGRPTVASTLTREERLRLAAADFVGRRCDRLWDLLWPLAREGDGDGLSYLAGAVLFSHLVLPDGIDWERKEDADALPLAIYSAVADKHPDKRHLRYIFDAIRRHEHTSVTSVRSGRISYRLIASPPAASITSLERCLNEANSPAAGNICVAKAIQLGLIPRFSEYRTAVDDVLAERRPQRCLPGPW